MKRGSNLAAALVLILVLGWMAGCGHVMPREALVAVDPDLDIARIMAAPDAYIGSTLLLGGPIVESRIEREGTVLEVLNYSLDRWGEPRSPHEAGGRMLARTERFLDPEIYQPGRFITFTGTLVGTERRPLGEREYLYPVFALEETYLWSPYQRGYYDYPGFYGPYPWYGPYYPYRWPYWGAHPWDPFWYDPFWYRPPHFRRW